MKIHGGKHSVVPNKELRKVLAEALKPEAQREAPRNPAKYMIHQDPRPRSLPSHFFPSFNPIAIDAITIVTATAKATKSPENKDLNVMVKVDSGTVIVTTSVSVVVMVMVVTRESSVLVIA
jgi:hypothetical protein